MNQELLVKISKWVLYASAGVLAVAVFFVFFGERGDRDMVRKYKNQSTLGTDEGISSRMGGWVSADLADQGVAVSPPSGAEPMPAEIGKEMMFSEIAPDASGIPPTGMEKRVIRNGNLSLRVEDAEWSADEIDRIATRLGGFTSSRMMNGQEVYPYPVPMMRGGAEDDAPLGGAKEVGGNTIQSGTVILRVPSSKFAEAVSAIKGIATVVVNESSSASDVTAQFADLEAQIKNKYAEEAAFTKILNTNPGKVSDVLEVTRELARVRGEIEQLETQKKYMESQTDMAEISVYLTEDAKVGAVTNTWRPWQTVKNALNHLLVKFQGFVDGVIYFVVSVLPFLALYLFGLWALFLVGRKVYRKMVGGQ
jgi:hypothetical protein